MTASGLATLAIAGCSSGQQSSTGDTPSASAAPTGSATAVADDPDRAALERAVALTSALLDLLARGGSLLDPTDTFAELHARHLSVLDDLSGPAASPSVGSAGPRPTPARLRRQEMNAQRQLALLAEQAESGTVARLLASMSAGIAAGLSRLDEVRR